MQTNYSKINPVTEMPNLVHQVNDAITDLHQSFIQFKEKQEAKMQDIQQKQSEQSHTFNYKNIHCETQYSQLDEAKNAFKKYLSKGETPNETKSYLLTRDIEKGGYLIPTINELDSKMQHLCPLRKLAKIDKIKSESIELLIDKNSQDAGWMLEDEADNEQITELAKIKITAHQLFARPKASQKIIDDTEDKIEEWLITKVTQKMSAMENNAFLNGDGENKPKGILTYPLVEVGKGEFGSIECISQTSDKVEIERETLFKIVSAMKAEYLNEAAWLMSRSAMNAIQNIKDEQGRFLWQPSLVLGVPSSLLGFPVYISDDMPKLEDNECVPILFANFKDGYQIIDRGDISVLRDPYSSKPYVEFYTTKRVGGDVINFDAIKAMKFNIE